MTLAIALEQRGLAVEVFEQAREFTEVGAGVGLSGNGTRLLGRLGVTGLEGAGVEPSALVFRHWKDGRIIVAHPMGEAYRAAFGAPWWGLHRVDLQRALTERLGQGVVELERRCVGVQQDSDHVTLTFGDGETVQADLVVGADGVRSVVRQLAMNADPPVFSGTVGYRGLAPVDHLPSLPDRSPLQFWAGPRRHLLHYPIQGGEIINFLAVVRQRRWTSQAWMEPCPVQDALAAFASWHPAVLEMVGSVQQASRWALYHHKPLERWSVGRVVLLGDAAHAMLPHQGQGANQTIEDAVTLADCLAEASKEDLLPALGHFEAQRRARTAKVQLYSHLAADCLHLPDGRVADTRDASLADLPTHLAWIHGFDAQDPSSDVQAPSGDEPGWFATQAIARGRRVGDPRNHESRTGTDQRSQP